MRIILLTALPLFLFSCQRDQELKTGSWRCELQMQGQTLPFNLEVTKTGNRFQADLKNAEESIVLDEISVKEDSVHITLHIFDSEIHAKINGDKLDGVFVKNYEQNYELPFRATHGETYRFEKIENQPAEDFSGKYAVTFVSTTDTIPSVGIFEQQQNDLTGTFLTPTGDYRYLQGNAIGNQMMLSTFDGNHAYIFKATKQEDGTLKGEYWSGMTGYETWTAVKDDNATLPDAESLTYLKEGFDRIEFSFPDVNGNLISPSDERFKDKVLILQIFGTWCPNCMDETKFLSQWYKDNANKGVEILGLAYEAKPDFNYAVSRIKKMKNKLDVPYDFVVAGTRDKVEAAKTLPMLNHILSFPTMIFIGRDGSVKKIHTGFSGPGTGVYYDQFVQHFNTTIDELLGENLASIQ